MAHFGTYRRATCGTIWEAFGTYRKLFCGTIGTYRRAVFHDLVRIAELLVVRIAELIESIDTYRRAVLGTYRSDICGTMWYVSQSFLGPLGTYRRAILVRIAELFGAHIGTYRRAIWCSAIRILIRIAELYGTYRRASCGTNWYVSQSYLWCKLVRNAELFGAQLGHELGQELGRCWRIFLIPGPAYFHKLNKKKVHRI